MLVQFKVTMEKFVSSLKNCKKNVVLFHPLRKSKYNQLKNKLKTVLNKTVIPQLDENGDEESKTNSKTTFEKEMKSKMSDLLTVLDKTPMSNYKIPKRVNKISKKNDKTTKKDEHKQVNLKKKQKLRNADKVSVITKPKNRGKKSKRTVVENKVAGKENAKKYNGSVSKTFLGVDDSSPPKYFPRDITLEEEPYHSMMETTADGSISEDNYESEKTIAVGMDTTSSPVVVQTKHRRTSTPRMMQDSGDNMQVQDNDFIEEFSSVLSCFKFKNNSKVVVRTSKISSHRNKVSPTVNKSSLVEVNRSNRFVDKSSSFELHSLPGHDCVMTMRHPSEVCVQGRVKVTVLKGTVEVLGFKLTSENSEGGVDVYCPQKCGCLSIASHKQQSEAEDTSYIKKLEGLKASYGKLLNKCLSSDCVLLLQKSSSVLTSFLNIHFPINLFPKVCYSNDRHFHKVENRLQCKFRTPGDDMDINRVMRTEEWEQVVSDMSIFADGSKTVVLGGKGVGKSTFLRFLANSCLSKCGAVLWLDFDPGQAEFTVPGCLSAVLVKEPLLGPNFTHVTTPLRMVYLGEIDVSRCPSRYNSCVKHIIDYCCNQPDLQDIPWFVNTMGFSKGLGVELAISIIRFLRPSNVIHIESKRRMQNFVHPLTSDYVNSYKSTWSSDSTACDVDYATRILPSMARSSPSSAPGLKPRESRELMVLAYLSQVVSHPRCSLLSVVPYCSELSKLSLGVCHEVVEPSHVLGAMNGCLVALCSSDNRQVWVSNVSDMARVLSQVPVTPCLGFGIVRGVDMAKKVLYLTTPLKGECLSQVNCLLMGAVSLPPYIYLAVEPGSGQVPYVSSGKEQAAMNRSVQRSFRRIVNS